MKHVKHLPRKYRHRQKSWIVGDIFEKLMRKFDRLFRSQDKKSFLINNYPAHPNVENLTNVNLIILQLNASRFLEDMGYGVTRSLKAYHRRGIVL